ncbi:apical merozoite protein, putative [Plasmodium gallinaceum]|uniref:Apical merozoite protein, putative n=1 Tax=Plasmodium gallinaceum TaxID=5849 RepID=A0A1J1GLL0_PLAGA|nr:apical merozoite protein, putative [Plasmodium gallinaceum]CRG93228.1 apical merozoite protein, putative [Plasmodium gallinaceum]
MNCKFSFFFILINIFLINFIFQCNNFNISNTDNIIIDNFHKNPKNRWLNKNDKKELEEKNISQNLVKINNDHHENSKTDIRKNIEKLKMLSENLKNGKLTNETENLRNAYNIDDGNFKSYVLNEIHNNKKLGKEKKSEEEIKFLEENSQKLLYDIRDWLQSVKNIEEKSNVLKDIKNQLLSNIVSLNQTLTQEMENINEIKKLQKEQNAIFSENWLYFFPSTSEYLLDDKKHPQYNILNYLEEYKKKEKESHENNVRKHNNISFSSKFFLNYFIIFLIIVIIFN